MIGGGATFARALADAAGLLAASPTETPRLDAEVLLRHLTGFDRTRLLVRLQESMPTGLDGRLHELVRRRLSGESIAYIVGAREFMGREFTVGPGVLVPRPETEALVELALGWLAPRPRSRIIDVGTGTGAVALSLAAGLSPARGDLVAGVERSSDAMAYAVRNRRAMRFETRVHLIRGDLAAAIGGPVDLLLANLPYLRPDQVRGNWALAAEPEEALVAGDDGLDLIRLLLADASRIMAPDGAIGLEIDPGQSDALVDLVGSVFRESRVTIHPDLAGFARICWIEPSGA